MRSVNHVAGCRAHAARRECPIRFRAMAMARTNQPNPKSARRHGRVRVSEGVEDYSFMAETNANGQFRDVVEEHWFDRLSSFQSARELIQALDKAVKKEEVGDKTNAVKDALVAWTGSGLLPTEFLRKPVSDGYGRRALHIDTKGEYSAVVMSWPPGVSTSIHDHGNLWCVECVVAGNIVVESFNVKEVKENVFDLEPEETVRAGKGSAGCLIPPFDVHRIGNQGLDTAITIHIYGGNLEKCNVFEEQQDSNLYNRVLRSLIYTHDMPWYEYNCGSKNTLSRDRTDVEIGGNV